MKASKCGWQAFVITGEAAEACGPTKGSLDHPTSWQKDKTSFGRGKFDDFKPDSMLGCRLRRGLARITLVHKGYLHRFAGCLLHFLSKFGDLIAVLFVGRGDFQGQQVAQRIDRDMNLRAFAPFIAVVTSALAALRRRLKRPTVVYGGAGLLGSLQRQPKDGPQIMRHRFEAARLDPTQRLLVDRVPGGMSLGIIRHGLPPARSIATH